MLAAAVVDSMLTNDCLPGGVPPLQRNNDRVEPRSLQRDYCLAPREARRKPGGGVGVWGLWLRGSPRPRPCSLWSLDCDLCWCKIWISEVGVNLMIWLHFCFKEKTAGGLVSKSFSYDCGKMDGGLKYFIISVKPSSADIYLNDFNGVFF